MNIIFRDSIPQQVDDKYILLELDTFLIEGNALSKVAYAVVHQVPLTEMTTLHQFKELHSNLLTEYRRQNWKYCEDAMEHLQGKWNGELDTFYSELTSRIQELKTQSLPSDWTGAILRSA